MLFFPFVAALAFTVSFLSRWAAEAYLHRRIPLIDRAVGLEPVQNPGVAFGLQLPEPFQNVIVLGAMIFICVLALASRKTHLSQTGYGLIVGGGLANIIDRTGDGFVTDFFQVGSFPVFNVADSCITIGAVLLLAEIFIMKRSN